MAAYPHSYPIPSGEHHPHLAFRAQHPDFPGRTIGPRTLEKMVTEHHWGGEDTVESRVDVSTWAELCPPRQELFDRSFDDIEVGGGVLNRVDSSGCQVLAQKVDGTSYMLQGAYLASGGFGHVFRGVSDLGEQLVVKIVDLARGKNKKQREGRRQSALQELTLQQSLAEHIDGIPKVHSVAIDARSLDIDTAERICVIAEDGGNSLRSHTTPSAVLDQYTRAETADSTEVRLFGTYEKAQRLLLARKQSLVDMRRLLHQAHAAKEPLSRIAHLNEECERLQAECVQLQSSYEEAFGAVRRAVRENVQAQHDFSSLDALGQLSKTLASVHRRGVAHCDLKLENILINDDGPSLIDFGLSSSEGAVLSSTRGTIDFTDVLSVIRLDQQSGVTTSRFDDAHAFAKVCLSTAFRAFLFRKTQLPLLHYDYFKLDSAFPSVEQMLSVSDVKKAQLFPMWVLEKVFGEKALPDSIVRHMTVCAPDQDVTAYSSYAELLQEVYIHRLAPERKDELSTLLEQRAAGVIDEQTLRVEWEVLWAAELAGMVQESIDWASRQSDEQLDAMEMGVYSLWRDQQELAQEFDTWYEHTTPEERQEWYTYT